MAPGTSHGYRVRQFAELAGVTVRTLHHYDRVGLLKPARSRSGYRVYADRDLERLEQIVALRFIGIPLDRMKSLLERNPRESARTGASPLCASEQLAESLRRQRALLEEKRRMLDSAIAVI